MKVSNLRLFTISLIIFVSTSFGQGLPFRYKLNHLTGFSSPVFLTNAGDGTRRIFIVQQRGIIKVLQPGSTVATDYLNISSTVSSSGSERGLLGLAFHPQFEVNRRFFVYYTRQTGTSSDPVEVAEYAQNDANPNIANPTPVRVIISIPHPGQTNHNGGTIAFGPDGYLYAAPGDGGSGNDPPNNAQNINVLLGKMLRLDINTPIGQVPAYNIPPSNPFAGAIDGADEIFAYGLRNPYRFSFDRGGSNQLWVADVGQSGTSSWEEVDNITLGANYGWKVCEGFHLAGSTTACTNPAYTSPIFEFSSGDSQQTNPTGRCSITGGYVYRGGQLALPYGAYVYADYCSGEILSWYGNQQTLSLDTSRNIVSFGEDEDGELYVVGQGGTIDKISGNKTAFDYDADAAANLSVFRPSTGAWYVSQPGGGFTQQQWGSDGDRIVPADYDGDGKTDVAVYRPDSGLWYVISSINGTISATQWGDSSDVNVPGDYDGDGKANLAVWRPSSGIWYVRDAVGGFTATQWGNPTDLPVPADYDGDGKFDVTAFRPDSGIWFVRHPDGSFDAFQFGSAGDKLVPADYDGDGKADLAVWRPSSGVWYIRQPGGGFTATQWGDATDRPVPADYDGNQRTNIAVWRPSTGVWYALNDTGGGFTATQWGSNGDIPTPYAFVK